MNLTDTSTNSPRYFYWKRIVITNENLNFDVRVYSANTFRKKPRLPAATLRKLWLMLNLSYFEGNPSCTEKFVGERKL